MAAPGYPEICTGTLARANRHELPTSPLPGLMTGPPPVIRCLSPPLWWSGKRTCERPNKASGIAKMTPIPIAQHPAPWPLLDLDPAAMRAAGYKPTPFRQFILKVHSRCNLSCSYCYVYEMADQAGAGCRNA